MTVSLTARIEALRKALPQMKDADSLAQAGEDLFAEISRLNPADKAHYAPQIAGLVAAFETAILTLETRIKDYR